MVAVSTTSERELADLAEQFGSIDVSRIRTDIPPGTATGDDVDRIDREIGPLCELLDGVLVERSGSMLSSYIGSTLAFRLGDAVESRDCGWILGAGAFFWLKQNLRAVSGSFIRREQLPNGLNKYGCSAIAPVLALDVLGPETTDDEMAIKRREFFAHGTELFWIVDPIKRTIAVYTDPDEPDVTLTEQDTLTGGDVLPGFTLAIQELFDDVMLRDETDG